ncbi:hypothetical protein F5884DRAFT_807408 [Xylogone sp. PMI_703]|nr:hypothetical protein F5884DRAFT_807408 [Xylogone sp. PMI_703]
MLDSNLPTFFIKPPTDTPLSNAIYFSQDESEPQPQYTLRRPDPKLPASKNCYAIALYDSYNPDVLYAEVLVQPEWQQATLTAAEIRALNGAPVPLVPIVPNNFIIQLYNPDQQVTVRQIPGSWNSSAYWEFDMPQTSFRQPSASMLDRSRDDPTASELTPKVSFKWKRDGKLSKDITCFLVGKTDSKKSKEPDIPIAMFKGSKTLALYQPNMHRVDLEDFKGLEMVVLLSASVIKDIYFNPNREMFNIDSPRATRKNSGTTVIPPKPTSPVATMSGAILPAAKVSSSPPLDPETVRLRAQIEAEEKERERRAREEEKRLKKMLEQEERERRRRDAEVEKETERLKKIYGVPPPLPSRQQPQPQFAPPPRQPTINQPYTNAQPFPQYYSAPHSRPPPVQRPVSTSSVGLSGGFDHRPNISNLSGLMGGSNAPPPQKRPHRNSGPYLQAPGAGNASSSGFFSSLGSNEGGHFGFGRNKLSKKKSFFL